MEHKYFECDCNDANHVVRFTWFQDEWEGRKLDREIYIEVFMNHNYSWYKRVWLALKYIFKADTKGCFGDVIWNLKTIADMKEFLNQFDSPTDEAVSTRIKCVNFFSNDCPHKTKENICGLNQPTCKWADD